MVEPGIYTGIPMAEYQAWDAVNNSLLKVLTNKTPKHAKYYKENPPESTPALYFGNALHTYILEPEIFKERFAIKPPCDKRTKGGKVIYQEWLATVPEGQSIIDESDYREIVVMAAALKAKRVHHYIEGGEAEVCVVWIDKPTGLLCKCRIDYVHRDRAFLIDLKSTVDASWDAFSMAIWRYQYHQQAGMYFEGWRAATGDSGAFIFVPMEKDEPFESAAYEAGDDIIEAGRIAFRHAITKYKQCLELDEWPGYKDIEMIHLPPWAAKKAGVGLVDLGD